MGGASEEPRRAGGDGQIGGGTDSQRKFRFRPMEERQRKMATE